MKMYASLALLLCAALLLSGCGSPEPAAPAPATDPSPDAPHVELPDEPAPPPPGPAFEDFNDDPDDAPMTLPGPSPDDSDDPFGPGAVGPTLDPPAGVEPDMPDVDDSAADETPPGVTGAFGAALWKGITQGAAGN